MSADQDRTFVRTFLAVLGGLIGLTFVIVIIAQYLTAATGGNEMRPAERARIEARTEPVFEVVTDPGALQKVAATGTKAPAQSEPAAEPKSGKEVYNSVCSTCHDAGVAGAPKIDDKALWASRLEDGSETLYKNAINGLNAMPAKGGNPSLSDEEVKNAVDYMLEQSGA